MEQEGLSMSRSTKGAPLIAAAASILGIWGLLAHAQATCLAADVAAAHPPATETKKQGGLPAAGDRGKADRYAREITRRSGVAVVSKALVEDIKKDVSIVLSTVAIRAHAGKDGRIAAYELVQIDRGSIPEKLGFRPGDVISEVNGVPARDFISSRQSLESARQFRVTILRKGKPTTLVVEIRQDRRK
jgi:membrane-associated protease RseP (regulator of RpoE activity)